MLVGCLEGSGVTEGRPRTSSAADRVLILFARFISAGYIGYAVILIPSIRDGWGRFALWWSVGSIVAVMGTGIVMGLATLSRSPSVVTVKLMANAAVIGYLVTVFTVPLGWEGPLYGAEQFLWPCIIPGLPALTAAIVWPPARTLIFLVVACVGAQVVQTPVRESGTYAPIYGDISFAFMFCLGFVAAAIFALRTGRIIDEVTEASHRAVATAAAADARKVERERFGALIHDGVMAVLLGASRLGAVREVGTQALSTLDQLDRLGRGTVEPSEYDVVSAIAVVRNAATAVDQRLDTSAFMGPGQPLPGDVVRAVAAATAEAVRNTAKHAGTGVRCAVDIWASGSGIRVTITDNGRGFELQNVPQHRLGLAVSVRSRMLQVRGTAEIVTAPGRGTAVTLRWGT